jgi:tetratricopeptide (TPR) repeat protein
MGENLAEVRKRLKENPDDPTALRFAARFYLSEGCYKQSQQLYTRSANISPRLTPHILIDYEAAIEKEPDKIGPRFALAGFLLSRQQVDASLLELEELLDLYPKQAEAYQALGKIYIKQEKIDDAIALLERSINQGVSDVTLREILAAAYLEKGKIAEAIKFYQEISSLKPDDKQTLRMLGELYTRTENYLGAARAYQAMFSEDPEVAREVVQRLEDLLKKVEGSIEIREILSEIYMRIIDPEAAVKKLREILRLESTKLPDIIQKLRSILKNYPNLPQAALALAEALLRQGNYSEAAENYYQLAKAKPEMIEEVVEGYRALIAECPQQVLARTYLGEALLYQGKITEALQQFGMIVEYDPGVAETVIRKCRDILRAHPQLVAAHITLGQAYLSKGEYQKAAAEAEATIAIDKKATGAYLLLGEAYSGLKMGSKAIEALLAALTLDPFNPRVQERYSAARKREVEAEIEAMQQRLQEDQWKVSLHLDLGRLYLQSGEREKALRELQVAVKDSARAAAAYSLIGNIYRSEGRFDLAEEQYQRALEANPGENAKSINLRLGSAAEAQGEVKKAIKIYERILQEDIDFGNLKKRVKALKSIALSSLRSRTLQAVFPCYGEKEIIALWSRETRAAPRAPSREEVVLSFGQEHNQAGFEYFMKGMQQAAEEEFTLAVQLDPHFAAALNNLAICLARQGRYEEARLRLMETVQLTPDAAVFFSNLGLIQFLLDRKDAARTALEKSLALDPEEAAVSLNLGDLYYREGKIEKAFELYRRVGDFDPLSDLAERRLLFKTPGPSAGKA